MNRKTLALIGLIIILAAVLRIVHLSSVPIAPYWEEAALGYDAFSIAQTGKDCHGNSFPLLAFSSFGDYKPSLYFYAVAPFTKLFGLGTFAVRFPSVLAGIGTLICIFIIGKKLFSQEIGLIAAFLFAIQPWNMHISRVGFETNLATFLITLGVLCVVMAREKIWYLLLSALCFGLSMYAYHSARIVAPLLGIATFLLMFFPFKKDFNKLVVAIIASVLLALAFSLPIFMNVKNPVVAQRAAETSIFSDLKIIKESNLLKEEDGNTFLSRILHHRYVLFGEKILTNMSSNFRLDFLFLDGDENPRHQTGEFGLLYHWDFISICVGLYLILKNRSNKHILLVLWMLIASIPPALTTVSPHTLRFLSASPAFSLVSALGLWQIIQSLKMLKQTYLRAAISLAIIVVILVELAAYVDYYFRFYPQLSASEWQYGYEELYKVLRENKGPTEQVYVTREQGRPAMYYAFYDKLDPVFVQSQSQIVPKDQQELLKIGDYTFIDEIPQTLTKGLYASSPDHLPEKANLLHQIVLPNGKVIWNVWRPND